MVSVNYITVGREKKRKQPYRITIAEFVYINKFNSSSPKIPLLHYLTIEKKNKKTVNRF